MNSDRNAGNWLVDTAGHLTLIDNGAAALSPTPATMDAEGMEMTNNDAKVPASIQKTWVQAKSAVRSAMKANHLPADTTQRAMKRIDYPSKPNRTLRTHEAPELMKALVYETTDAGSLLAGTIVLRDDGTFVVEKCPTTEGHTLCQFIATTPASFRDPQTHEMKSIYPSEGAAFLQALPVVYSGSHLRVGVER